MTVRAALADDDLLAREGIQRMLGEAREIELVAVRTAEVTPGPAIDLQATRPRRVGGSELVELDGATAWVPEGWSGATDDSGTLVLRR